MTKKAEAIERMLSGDRSGRLRLLHDQLVSIGLKTKMPPNSSTLLFEAVTPTKERIGLVALRDSGGDVFSFPSPYWLRRMGQVNEALSGIDSSHFIPTEGAVSTSQYSARQVRVSAATVEQLMLVVSGLISRHVRQLTGAA